MHEAFAVSELSFELSESKYENDKFFHALTREEFRMILQTFR